MIALVRADLLKLRRLRGLWWSALGIPAALMALVVVLDLTGAADVTGGGTFVRDIVPGGTLVTAVLGIVLGARIGSLEHAAGTIRYVLLTGASRPRVYLSQLAVAVLGALAIGLSLLASAVAAALVLGAPPADPLTPEVLVDAAWAIGLTCVVYGVMAFGIGALSRSTGPAIAIALVLLLVGATLVGLLTLIDDALAVLVLPRGLDRLTLRDTDPADELGLLAAIAVTLAYPGCVAAAGLLRLLRLEP